MLARKLIFLCFYIFAPYMAISQQTKSQLLTDINEEMWKPFIEGIKNDKPELYLNIHSKEFYWVSSGKKSRIMNYKEYDSDSQQVMKQRNQQGATSDLEIRFLDRTISPEFASEKCIMKFTFYQAGKAPQVSYGISYIFSRKENGIWKMLVQQANVAAGSEELFKQAAALDEVDKS